MKEKLDPRVIRTRQMLRNAFVSLVKEDGFDTIRVQDITDRATLNRATFYLHYRDKTDLLIKSVQETLAEATTEIMSSATSRNELSPEAVNEALASLFRHFAQHADFYSVMLCEIGVPSVLDEVQHYIESMGLQWLGFLQPDKEQHIVETDMVIKFISAAYVGVIKWWIEKDMPYSPEHMAEQFMNLVSLGIFRSIGLEIPPIIVQQD